MTDSSYWCCRGNIGQCWNRRYAYWEWGCIRFTILWFEVNTRKL